MKSLIYILNNGTQSATDNQPLKLGTIARRYGKAIGYDGSTTIMIYGRGYFDVDVSATVTGTVSAGNTVQISVLNGNTTVQTQEATLANDESQNVAIISTVRVFCCSPMSVITITTTGTPDVSNLAIRVKEV